MFHSYHINPTQNFLRMKTILLILSFFPSLIYAQFTGIKGGASISNTYSGKNGFLISPTYGIVYSKFKNQYRFTFEPSINTKGFYNRPHPAIVNGTPVTDDTDQLYFSFVEFPLTYGWLPVNKKFYFGIHAGLAPGYIYKGIFTTASSVSPSIYIRLDTERKFNIDLLAGIETGVRVSENLFFNLNIRYGTNILDIGNFYFYYIAPTISVNYKLKQKTNRNT
jgi:hypothetical protein